MSIIAATNPTNPTIIHYSGQARWWGGTSGGKPRIGEMYLPFDPAGRLEGASLEARLHAAASSAQDAYAPRRVPGSQSMYVLVDDGWESPTHFIFCRGREVIGIFPISPEGCTEAVQAL